MHKNFWLKLLLLAFDFHVASHDVISQDKNAVELSCLGMIMPPLLCLRSCCVVAATVFKIEKMSFTMVLRSFKKISQILRFRVHSWIYGSSYGTERSRVRKTPDETRILIEPFCPTLRQDHKSRQARVSDIERLTRFSGATFKIGSLALPVDIHHLSSMRSM
jgi:hypothetical protein